METDLIKAAALLEICFADPVMGVTFAPVTESSPDSYDSYIVSASISYEAWKDMGSPTQVTVSVEPGDKLNEAGEMASFFRHMSQEKV